VVENELERRGLSAALFMCNQWIEEHWYDFYKTQRETRNVTGTKRSIVRQQKAG